MLKFLKVAATFTHGENKIIWVDSLKMYISNNAGKTQHVLYI